MVLVRDHHNHIRVDRHNREIAKLFINGQIAITATGLSHTPTRRAINQLMPPKSYEILMFNGYPCWLRWTETWSERLMKVKIPFTSGDYLDIDANYLHAANRNNI